MDMIGIVIVHYIFSFLGASLRFIVINLINLISNKKLVSFKFIWEEKKTHYGQIENEVLNTLIGFLLFFIIASLIIKYNW